MPSDTAVCLHVNDDLQLVPCFLLLSFETAALGQANILSQRGYHSQFIQLYYSQLIPF